MAGAEEFRMQVTAILSPAPEGGFTALNPETGSTGQGATIEEMIAKEAARQRECEASWDERLWKVAKAKPQNAPKSPSP